MKPTEYPSAIIYEPRKRNPEEWKRRHNDAIDGWQNDGALHPRQESAILELGLGIVKWAELSGYADDGFLGPECFVPLVQAFRAALNGDCGRLDCGTLDSWASSLLESYGYNADTYEWNGQR